jgi:redox-sensitive bicupin YhaK (pirin superfamily)
MSVRPVKNVVPAHRQLEGGGFPVRRPFPTHGADMVDPFLLLDEMGPVNWGPREAIGAPDHPHRGFETVTYVLSGAMQHRDSTGRTGDLTPGDVQWMTAGSGLIHSELPEPKFFESGGVMHGFQIWVNLPKAHKMTAPRYQEIPSAGLPVGQSADGKVWARVIAGAALGQKAVIDTFTPITYLHFKVQPGGSVDQPVPADHNAFAWVFKGTATLGDPAKPVAEGHMATFGPGDAVRIAVPDDGAETELLLLSGRPINEPVARYGPFVMNTKQEILQAIDDFRNGRMGRIAH